MFSPLLYGPPTTSKDLLALPHINYTMSHTKRRCSNVLCGDRTKTGVVVTELRAVSVQHPNLLWHHKKSSLQKCTFQHACWGKWNKRQKNQHLSSLGVLMTDERHLLLLEDGKMQFNGWEVSQWIMNNKQLSYTHYIKSVVAILFIMSHIYFFKVQTRWSRGFSSAVFSFCVEVSICVIGIRWRQPLVNRIVMWPEVCLYSWISWIVVVFFPPGSSIDGLPPSLWSDGCGPVRNPRHLVILLRFCLICRSYGPRDGNDSYLGPAETSHSE